MQRVTVFGDPAGQLGGRETAGGQRAHGLHRRLLGDIQVEGIQLQDKVHGKEGGGGVAPGKGRRRPGDGMGEAGGGYR